MEYTNLGRTGLLVSRLCLGTMNFGPKSTEPESHAIMDRALEHEINFFDTANVYGWKLGEGVTEHIIGRWFAQGGGRREKVVLATKVYGTMQEWPNGQGLSARHIVREADASLKRLQTDYIDLYQMHHISRTTPWDEIWQAMELLVSQGKVLYVGSSNFAGWHIAQAQETASKRHFLGLVAEQSLYNLLARAVELEVLPAAQQYGLGVIPWSPLHGGLLGGALAKIASGSAARSAEGRAADDLAANWATTRRTWRSPGCWHSRPSPHRSSVHARSSNSTRRSARCRWSSPRRRSRSSTSSSRRSARVVQARKRGPGSHFAVSDVLPRSSGPAAQDRQLRTRRSGRASEIAGRREGLVTRLRAEEAAHQPDIFDSPLWTLIVVEGFEVERQLLGRQPVTGTSERDVRPERLRVERQPGPLDLAPGRCRQGTKAGQVPPQPGPHRSETAPTKAPPASDAHPNRCPTRRPRTDGL
jgi:NDP-hexose 2,3-enoyl reductase